VKVGVNLGGRVRYGNRIGELGYGTRTDFAFVVQSTRTHSFALCCVRACLSAYYVSVNYRYRPVSRARELSSGPPNRTAVAFCIVRYHT